VSLRARHGFNPDTPRRLSTPTDAPLNSTPTSVASRGPSTLSGCSGVMSMREPKIVGALGPEDEGVLIRVVDVPEARRR